MQEESFCLISVGDKAGEIWKYLNESGDEATTIQLKASLMISNSLLYLALGWLCREDKIEIKPLDKGYIVKLK